MKKEKEKEKNSSWKQRELLFLVLYAAVFYCVIIRRSLQLSSEYYGKLYGLRLGWLAGRFNDASDAQWRNFRSNLPILTIVFGLYSVLPQILRVYFKFKVRGMSVVWLLISLTYLLYLHGACIIFILSIAFLNYLLVKMSARTKYFSFLIWAFNVSFLICNRVYEGYSFSEIGWQICFNFVVLRMISYGYDYHWAHRDSHFDHEKHSQHCHACKTGCMCYVVLQERSVPEESYSFITYLCYLVFAPLYLAGPIISFNAFASQLDTPQNNYSISKVALYGLRWFMNLLLMELMTHFFYYNAFAISGLWKQLSPFDVFIIGYGVLNFMWLKFLLIWRYFRLWSLINGIEPPENMPRCINNCYNLESFWKSWHASFNKWLVRYMYIPLGGSRRKLVNVWVVFTFVAIWHDLEWKLLSWAWLTCIFFIPEPEMAIKSAANSFQAESAVGKFIHRELHAFAGAITITCLMVANLVGYVIGPSGMNWLVSRFLNREGLPVLGGMFMTFYVGTKLMLHIQEMKTSNRQGNQP